MNTTAELPSTGTETLALFVPEPRWKFFAALGVPQPSLHSFADFHGQNEDNQDLRPPQIR
jgi:hypothetical protein